MKSLADPTKLKPVDKDGLIQVIIETPAGSRNKLAFDPEQEIFTLKAVLPAGMAFPYDFGFLPSTRGGDGDPIDVLLLMDEPAYPGVAVKARIIGVMEGEQTEGKKKVRNDRVVAVAQAAHSYANVQTINDLPKKWLHELQTFFVNYHELQGRQYKLLGMKSAAAAMRLIRQGETPA